MDFNPSKKNLLIEDILFTLFPFLSIKDLAKCEQVNKQFNKILKNSLIWKIMVDNNSTYQTS